MTRKYTANSVADAESTRGNNMKKKIIGIAVVASILMTGVVSAASMWGTYKGNEIIRITSNGTTLKTTDVPAISYNSRTMIPINMLSDIGLRYTWDQKNKTVDVSGTGSASSEQVSKMKVIMDEHRAFITFLDQSDLVSLCIDILNNTVNNDQYQQGIQQVNRINIDALDNHLQMLSIIKSNQVNAFSQVRNYIQKSKNSLLTGDTKTAYTQMLSAKTALNVIYPAIDDEYFNTFVLNK